MSNTSRPEDFDAYWQQVCHELEVTPIAAEEEHLPIRSTEFCECYTVRFTGIGPYRLFGYLSIPHGDGPFPTLLIGPAYRSVVDPLPQGDANEKRGRFVVFSSAGRGQRNADKPYAGLFPGMMTEGIDTSETSIFRGFVADWLRAVDYLLTRPEVDRSRIAAIQKDGMPLLTAALRPEVTHVVASPGDFYNTRHQVPVEVEDYLRLYPEKEAQVKQTVSYFDPICFAPNVRARTLLWGNPEEVALLTEAFAGEIDVRQSEHSTYRDGLFQERWIADQFGFDDVIIPAHWQ